MRPLRVLVKHRLDYRKSKFSGNLLRGTPRHPKGTGGYLEASSVKL